MMKRIKNSEHGFTLVELMVVVAIIGILAAVAIPAFMKNVKKSKTAEATINVKKITEGAVAYIHGEMNAAGSAVPIAKQFPTTEVATPALGACCLQPGQKCAPNHAQWTTPAWQALTFGMDDPHYYSYTYTRNANGASGTPPSALADGSTPSEFFFADAQGDLNCDAIYSTFEMFGAVAIDGSITTGAGIYSTNELE